MGRNEDVLDVRQGKSCGPMGGRPALEGVG